MIRRLSAFLFTDLKALQAFHIMRQGSVILIAVLLTKTGLGADSIGAYEMLLYLGGLVTSFWIQGLVQALLSEYPRLPEEEQRQLTVNAYGLFLFLGLSISAVMILARPLLLPWLSGQPHVAHYEWFFLYVALNFPAFLLENFFLLWRQPRLNFLYGLLSSLPMVVVVVLPPYLGYGLEYSIYGLVGLAFFRHLFLLYHLVHRGQWRFRPDLIVRWWRIALPLIAYALLAGVNFYLDSWLVGQYYKGDETRFAIFRYGARELPLVMALVTALSTAMVPRVAADTEAGLLEIREKSRKLFHLLFPLSIILMLTSGWFFPLVFSEAFDESVHIFNIFLLVSISRMVFSRTVLVALQDNKVILLISLVELAVHLALSFWLIRPFGLAGVAWGNLLAISLEKVLITAYLYFRFGIGWQRYTDLRWLVVYGLLLVGAFVLVTWL